METALPISPDSFPGAGCHKVQSTGLIWPLVFRGLQSASGNPLWFQDPLRLAIPRGKALLWISVGREVCTAQVHDWEIPRHDRWQTALCLSTNQRCPRVGTLKWVTHRVSGGQERSKVLRVPPRAVPHSGSRSFPPAGKSRCKPWGSPLWSQEHLL